MVDDGESITGWWSSHFSEKYESYEFVIWDDDIPNCMEKLKKMFQTTNQEYFTHLN